MGSVVFLELNCYAAAKNRLPLDPFTCTHLRPSASSRHQATRLFSAPLRHQDSISTSSSRALTGEPHSRHFATASSDRGSGVVLQLSEESFLPDGSSAQPSPQLLSETQENGFGSPTPIFSWSSQVPSFGSWHSRSNARHAAGRNPGVRSRFVPRWPPGRRRAAHRRLARKAQVRLNGSCM